VRVTLISDTSLHLFQPLLYQVATGILSTGYSDNSQDGSS
jgi:NADH dehydrogenase